MRVYVDFTNHKVATDEFIDDIIESEDFQNYLMDTWNEFLDCTDLEGRDPEEIGDFEDLNDCQQNDIYEACFEDYMAEYYEVFEFPSN